MANTRRPVQTHNIEVEYEGKTYHGTYSVEREILTVRSSFGSRSTQLGLIGTMNRAGRATQILRELASEQS